MTFNIRYSEGDRRKINDWNNRKKLVIDIIRKYNPDIIGFQEVLQNQLDYLIEKLDDYKWVGVGREDGKNKGEFNPIFYRGYEIENYGTFWLSNTPEKCSRTWRMSIRICTWIKIKGDFPFAFFNTHFHNKGKNIRLKSSKLVIKKIEEISPKIPIILTGDFNADKSEKSYEYLAKHLKDSYLSIPSNVDDKKISFHNYTGKIINDSEKQKDLFRIIDFIWIKKFDVVDSKIINDSPMERKRIYPSDHWPIYSDLIIENS